MFLNGKMWQLIYIMAKETSLTLQWSLIAGFTVLLISDCSTYMGACHGQK